MLCCKYCIFVVRQVRNVIHRIGALQCDFSSKKATTMIVRVCKLKSGEEYGGTNREQSLFSSGRHEPVARRRRPLCERQGKPFVHPSRTLRCLENAHMSISQPRRQRQGSTDGPYTPIGDDAAQVGDPLHEEVYVAPREAGLGAVGCMRVGRVAERVQALRLRQRLAERVLQGRGARQRCML